MVGYGHTLALNAVIMTKSIATPYWHALAATNVHPSWSNSEAKYEYKCIKDRDDLNRQVLDWFE